MKERRYGQTLNARSNRIKERPKVGKSLSRHATAVVDRRASGKVQRDVSGRLAEPRVPLYGTRATHPRRAAPPHAGAHAASVDHGEALLSQDEQSGRSLQAKGSSRGRDSTPAARGCDGTPAASSVGFVPVPIRPVRCEGPYVSALGQGGGHSGVTFREHVDAMCSHSRCVLCEGSSQLETTVWRIA